MIEIELFWLKITEIDEKPRYKTWIEQNNLVENVNRAYEKCKNDKTEWSNNVYFAPNQNVIFCLQPKAASTDLTKVVRFLSQTMCDKPGFCWHCNVCGHNSSVHSIVQETLMKHSKCPKPVLLTAKNHEKFINGETEAVIFVREPLERLLAGYRMMFNHPNVTKQNYDLFTRPILNKVRFEGKSVMPKSPVEAWEKAGFYGHASRLPKS